jgi:DNA-nicking Smr family endonuclease
MSKGRKPRGLSTEERRLWDQVARTAEPLRLPLVPQSEETVAEEKRPLPKPPRRPASPVANPTPRPGAPPPGSLDHRTRTRLSRGTTAVDLHVDLHGLTQSAAHQRLRRFLERAQADDARLVLVITGKGKPGADGGFGREERGVLRRAVPVWLESAEFRHLVAGFDEAGRRHGGAGALYVRVRRRRVVRDDR